MAALWSYLTCSNGLTVISTEEFRSLRLAFSPNLDDYNPDIPEWRRDISRVIKKSLVEVSMSIPFSPSNIVLLRPRMASWRMEPLQRMEKTELEPRGDVSLVS